MMVNGKNVGNRDTWRASLARRRKVNAIYLNGRKVQYSSLKQCSQDLGIHVVTICNCCRGRQKYSGGFRFEYAD